MNTAKDREGINIVLLNSSKINQIENVIFTASKKKPRRIIMIYRHTDERT